MKKYIDLLMEEAQKAIVEKEIPVSAIIVKDGEVIAIAHNTRVKANKVIAHAEVNCILEAEAVLGDWRLNGCDMYVTLEPCEMCKTIIRESRVDNVYFLVERQKNKVQYTKTNVCMLDVPELKSVVENYQKKLGDFFKLNGKR